MVESSFQTLFFYGDMDKFLSWTMVALILLIITTHLVSTLQFYRIAKSATPGAEPPTAPYWLPGLYHLTGLVLTPSLYIQGLLNSYASLSPFFCRAGPISLLIVTNPAHIKSLFLNSKQLSPKKFHLTLYENVFGLPKQAIEIYAADESTCKDSQSVNFAHLTLNRRYMSGEPLAELTELYLRTLRKNLGSMDLDLTQWTYIEDLWSFLRQEIPKAAIEVILGPTILDMYPDFVNQFWAFDDHIQEYSRGMLKHALTSLPNAARNRILESIKTWIAASQPECPDTEAIAKEDFWNFNTGSKLFRHRDGIFAGISALGLEGRASETLSLLEGANANTMPSTFWYIFEVLRHHKLRDRVERELGVCGPADPSSSNITSLCANPLFQSMQSEVARLRMATAVIRTVDADNVLLSSQYSIRKGTTVLAFPSHAALQTDAWRKVRPQTVVRPLEEFWAERFLVYDTQNSAAKNAEKESDKRPETMKYSMEGLNALNFTFGGGKNMCPGRAWARNIQIATLAVLFGDYELELVDVAGADSLIPPLRTSAVGVIRPLGKVSVRIRARDKKIGGN